MKVENRVYILDVNGLEDKGKFRDWYEKMPDFRKEKIDKMKPENSKRLSLGAGILFYEGLKELGIDPESVEIRLGENEKPYLVGEGVFFNLSHSDNVAVAAFSDKEVGIDVEKIKTFNDGLIKYVFDESEICAIKSNAEKNGNTDLVRYKICLEDDNGKEEIDSNREIYNSLYTGLWTMKESVMKYNGKGISMNPKKIVIDDGNAFYEGKRLENLHFTRFEYEDYHISVCSEYSDFCAEMIEKMI